MVSIEPAGDLGGRSMKDYSTMSKHEQIQLPQILVLLCVCWLPTVGEHVKNIYHMSHHPNCSYTVMNCSHVERRIWKAFVYRCMQLGDFDDQLLTIFMQVL